MPLRSTGSVTTYLMECKIATDTERYFINRDNEVVYKVNANDFKKVYDLRQGNDLKANLDEYVKDSLKGNIQLYTIISGVLIRVKITTFKPINKDSYIDGLTVLPHSGDSLSSSNIIRLIGDISLNRVYFTK